MLSTKTTVTTNWEDQLAKQSFSWASFQFLFQALEESHLPAYKGSTIRGGFGAAFKRVCCTVKNVDCNVCILNQNCPYSYIFETPNLDHMNINHHTTNLPHPFIIEPPLTPKTEFQQGDELSFGLVLIGKSISFLPYFIYSFDQMGRMGLGKMRGRFELVSVHSVEKSNKVQVYDSKTQTLNGNFKVWTFDELLTNNSKESIGLKFITPTRIKDDNRLSDTISFPLFIRTLIRRISLLGRIHCESNWELPYQEIISQAEQTVDLLKNETTWIDWERYSNRQKVRMIFGGIVGEVIYKGLIQPFLPLIRLGEIIHIGKNTSFGLGKYVVENNMM